MATREKTFVLVIKIGANDRENVSNCVKKNNSNRRPGRIKTREELSSSSSSQYKKKNDKINSREKKVNSHVIERDGPRAVPTGACAVVVFFTV